jgi:RNA polymerase sigma-70 factor, ECF subfamily
MAEDQHGIVSDEALARRVASQDRSAFSELYDRYARSVYAMAAHVVGTDEADEILQDVFTRLWSKADQFDASRGIFAAWFMTIVRNRLRDELHRRTFRERIVAAEAIDQLLTQTADPNSTLEEAAWIRERAQTILEALQHLPEEQRQALVLAYFADLSQSTIAEQLNWPLGTVKKRIRLGLQKLRHVLKPHDMQLEAEAASQEPETDTGN